MSAILLLIGRRALVSVIILLIVSALQFCILRLLPVDPAAMSLPPTATLAEIEVKRQEMGLHLPLPQQYAIWLGQVLHGDFGTSIHFRRSVRAGQRWDRLLRYQNAGKDHGGDAGEKSQVDQVVDT